MKKQLGKIINAFALVTLLMTSVAVSAKDFDPGDVDNNIKSAISAPDADIAMIAAGYFHTCALKTGAVFCWGSNAAGQLGNRNSSVTQSNLPVMAISAGVKELSAGGYHTCALLEIGTVYCWGSNFDSQSGQPVTGAIYTPTIVSGFFNVASISAGTSHTCAIKNGGAKCWGSNDRGELGDGVPVGFNQSTHIPQDVVGLTSGVTQISAGNGHTCAVQNGGAKCWGSNNQGELGAGFVSNPDGLSTPQDVVGLTSGVSKISAGTSHSCAVTTGGGAKCWGANLNGQGGNGTNSNISIADDVEGLTSGVSEIEAAGAHSCALTTGGAVKCWGRNNGGYLGNGTFNDSNTPFDVTGLNIEVSAISAPSFSSHTCALQNGIPKCWGSNSSGELGDNSKSDRNTPVPLYLPAPTFGPLKNITDGTAGTIKDTNNVYLKWKALPLVGFYQVDSKTDDGDWTPLVFIDGDAIRKESLQKNIPASVTCYRIRSWIWTEKSDWSKSNCVTLNAESKYIDVSISYYSQVDLEKRASFEEVVDHFADGIYEMNNGAHQVRNVYFFLNGEQKHDADVIWNESEWPRATLNGYHYRTGPMWMADFYPFDPNNPYDALKEGNLKGTGYTFAHEFGHYFYGIQDEYVLKYAIKPNNPRGTYGFNWAFTLKDDLYIAKAGYEVKKIEDDWWVIPIGQIDGVKIDPNHVPTDSDNYTIRDDKYIAKSGYEVTKKGEIWKWGYEGDVQVLNSVMADTWNASRTGNLNYLNFSTILNNHTPTNNQFRRYKASAWDTLTRDVTKDPKKSEYYKRVFMPELVEAETPPVPIQLGFGFALNWPQPPKHDLPTAKSREKINVVWIEPESPRSPDVTHADSEFSPIIESGSGQLLEYPEPAVIAAQLLKNDPIALATLTTTVTKPDGLQMAITLKDDGIAPDDQAEDGLYTGYLDYDQDGEYLIEVEFSNPDGVAFEVDVGAGILSPDGETRPASSALVGTGFLEEALTIVEITGYAPDDHNNTPNSATAISDEGEDVSGRIDYAGDIDVFEITPSKTGKLNIWLYQLGLEMEADIQIYESDGSTLISSHTFSPEDENLVFETQIDAIESEIIYVEVKHQSSAATQGMYTISADQEAEEEPTATVIFLPLVVR